MKIYLENLGKIKKGKITPNKLSILCGPNNFGKTYLAYSLYGIDDLLKNIGFEFSKEEKENLLKNKKIDINLENLIKRYDKISKKISKRFKANLDSFFNYDKSYFKETKFDITIEKKDLLINSKMEEDKYLLNLPLGMKLTIIFQEKKTISIMISNSESENTDDGDNDYLFYILSKKISEILFVKPFILPSVREGLNMFKSELNINRNVLIDTLMSHKNKKINPFSIMDDMVSRYPKPISEYIEFINGLEGKVRKKGPYSDLANNIGKIVGGSYSYENTQIYFKPYKSDGLKLPLHMASSTARSLAGLYLYLKYDQNPQKIIIDEPELNLHPENQRKIARFLVKLVNSGVNVTITTHSSYLLQEFNNLILLNSNFKGKECFMRKNKYKDAEVLNINDISCYLVDKGEIKEMKIEDQGIIMDTFNEVIGSMNNIFDELLFLIEEEKELEEQKLLDKKKVMKEEL